VTFASASGQVNNKTVEIGGSKWQLTQGTTVKEMPGSGTSMTLNTDNPPSGITLRSGDKVTIKVKHVNLWDEASENWSDGYDYTVGTAGGSAAPQDEVTLILRKRTADYGINTIALPFKTVYDARGGEVKTLKDLVESLNAAGNGNGYVSTFAYWDPENQKEVAFTFNANGGVVDRINATMPLSEVTLERGKGYQVTVTESITVTFRNYQ
jgi:hypothetical protein